MPIFNDKFCFKKEAVQPNKEKVPQIKSLLLVNFLNTINNRRNNDILYKVKFPHLVR